MILLEVFIRTSLLFRRNSLSDILDLGKIILNQSISKWTWEMHNIKMEAWLWTMNLKSKTLTTAMISHTIWLMTPKPCKKDLQKKWTMITTALTQVDLGRRTTPWTGPRPGGGVRTQSAPRDHEQLL